MRPLLILLVLTLAGCETDQYDKPGTWKLPPTGQASNDANLRTMVVNPNDLLAGSNDPGSNAYEAVRPVEHLYSGRRSALPSGATTSVGGGGGGGGGGQQQGGGGQAGGAGGTGGPGGL